MYQLQTRAANYPWVIQGETFSDITEEILEEFQNWQRDKTLSVRIIKITTVLSAR